MAQAPRSMFGGFYGNSLKIAGRPNPLGAGQAPMAPTQYTPVGQRPVQQPVQQPLHQPMRQQAYAQPQAAPAAPAAPAGQQFARTPNGPVPMGPPGSCPICH